MSEPIKPRIDFAGPLDVEQNPAFKAQQTFSETQAQSFPRPPLMNRWKKRGRPKR